MKWKNTDWKLEAQMSMYSKTIDNRHFILARNPITHQLHDQWLARPIKLSQNWPTLIAEKHSDWRRMGRRSEESRQHPMPHRHLVRATHDQQDVTELSEWVSESVCVHACVRACVCAWRQETWDWVQPGKWSVLHNSRGVTNSLLVVQFWPVCQTLGHLTGYDAVVAAWRGAWGPFHPT